MNNTHLPHDVKTSDGIKRTAAELAAWRPQVVAEYLALHTGEKATIRHLILHRAAVSSFVSDAMFRQLFVELGFTKNETCCGSEACNDRIAALLGEDPRTVKRLHAQMEKIGLAEKPQRRKNRSSVRGFSPLSLAMILNPVLGSEVTNLSLLISERTKVSLLEPRKDIPVPCEPLASDKSAPLTLLEEDEEDKRDACASENGSNFEVLKSGKPHPIATDHHFERWHNIGNRWGQTLGVIALNHPKTRAEADHLLRTMLAAFVSENADMLRQAFAATMAEIEGRILGEQKSVGFGAMANYARNTLKTEIAKAKLDAAKLEAGRQQVAAVAEIAISKEKTIADQGVVAHAVAIEAGAKAREARTTQSRPGSKASARAAALSILADRKAARASDPIEQAISQGGDERILRALGDKLLNLNTSADLSGRSGQYLLNLSESLLEVDGLDDEILAWAQKSLRDYTGWRPTVGAIKEVISSKALYKNLIKTRSDICEEIYKLWDEECFNKENHLWERMGGFFGGRTVDEDVIFRDFCERKEREYASRMRSSPRCFYEEIRDTKKGRDKYIQVFNNVKATWGESGDGKQGGNDGGPASKLKFVF